MSVYHIDFETYCERDIKLGAYRYASDPSTKILFCALAVDDEPPVLWDRMDWEAGLYFTPVLSIEPPHVTSITDHPFYKLLGRMISDEAGLIYAHNAQFEIAVCRYLFEKTFALPPPDLDRWRCTAAMCRRAAIPWSLAGASEFLGLKTKKMTAGRTLIGLFSMPHVFPKTGKVMVDGKKMTVEEAWDLFGQYCKQDVEAEREVHQKLSAFEMSGTTLKAFQFDIRMNDRGIPVNVSALRKAHKVVSDFTGVVIDKFKALTGLNISQTGEIQHLFEESWNYPEGDLQAATIDRFLESPPGILLVEHPHLRQALELRRAYSYAAVKKIPTMISSACSDGRVRGGFMWSGALRTHRWSGRIIQPQNFKRPKFKDTALAHAMIKANCTHEDLAVMWGEPLEVIASSIRHFIEDPAGDIIDADFSSIEARVAPWLAGQTDMLDEFRRGEGLYENMAAVIFGIEADKVNGDQRFVGKTAALGCQFGMSWKKFQSSCRQYGRDLDDKICQTAVFKYRKKRALIVQAWKDIQAAAVWALNNPGEPRHINDKLVLTFGKIGGFAALTMRLPSGHLLVYPYPEIAVVEIETDAVEEDDITGELILVHKVFTTEQISFYGPLPLSVQWGRITTHGGKLFENAVQAVAGDFMTHALLRIEEAGFEPFATIHDQALAPFARGRGGDNGDRETLERFKAAFCSLPRWASDFPLEAEVKVTPFYQKD
jgi:DNA polymerase